MRALVLLPFVVLILGADGDGMSVGAVVAGIAAAGGAAAALWQLIAVGRAVGKMESRLEQVEKSLAKLDTVPVDLATLRTGMESVRDTALRALSAGPGVHRSGGGDAS